MSLPEILHDSQVTRPVNFAVLEKKSLAASERDRPDVQRGRAEWCRRVAAINPDRFVFLDETATHRALTRLYGRAAPGQRVGAAVPHAHWQITTLVAAIRLDGAGAPLVFEGATDAAVFRVYVERVLRPQLRPGDIVVMDNLSSHKGDWVAAALAKVQAEVWYLPPYAPDYNQIEPMWAKVKGWLRVRRPGLGRRWSGPPPAPWGRSSAPTAMATSGTAATPLHPNENRSSLKY